MFQGNGIITPSTFCVYEEYEFQYIEEKRLNKEHTAWIIEEDKYIKKASDKIKRCYNPLVDTPELLTEFLKIDINDDKSILAFVNEYGLPSQRGPNLSGITYVANEFDFSHDMMLIDKDTSSSSDIKRIAKMWNAIGEKDYKAMDSITKRFEEIADKNKTYNEEWEKVKNKEPEIISKSFLAMKLNSYNTYSSSHSIGFQLSGKKIVPIIIFMDLFEVANWQLTTAITNEIYFKTCENCGHIFLPQHGHQRFCPPIIGRKTSTCQNTFNQRAKRARKKAMKTK